MLKPSIAHGIGDDQYMNCMNTLQGKQPKQWGRMAILTGVSLMILGVTLAKAQPPAPSAQPAPSKKTQPAKPAESKPQLTGEELYQINCNRCHSERYPTEFTPAQWETIMIEMRVRANLPAEQSKKILKYLQADSGN